MKPYPQIPNPLDPHNEKKATNHGMQQSGGGAVFDDTNINFLRPLNTDGLEPYHLDGDVQSEYHMSLLPLFGLIPDPSVADVVQYLASQTTTSKMMD